MKKRASISAKPDFFLPNVYNDYYTERSDYT